MPGRCHTPSFGATPLANLDTLLLRVMLMLMLITGSVSQHLPSSQGVSSCWQPLRGGCLECVSQKGSKWYRHHSRQLGTTTRSLGVSGWLAHMHQLGTASNSNVSDCDAKFGLGYLRGYRSSQVHLCTYQDQEVAEHMRSSLACYTHPDSKTSPPEGGIFCFVKNMVLNSAEFMGPDESHVPTRGSVKVGCQLPQQLPWPDAHLQDHHLERWLQLGMQSGASTDVSAACSQANSTVKQPVLFVTRWDSTNNFHHFEEVVNTYIELLLYPKPNLLAQGVQIVFTDFKPPGYFLELWRRVAYPASIRFLQHDPFPPGTCFKNAIIAATPTRSLYTYTGSGKATICRSLVLQSVVGWAQHLMRDVRPEFYHLHEQDLPQNAQMVVGKVLWLSRRNFELAHAHALNGWQKERVVSNEDEWEAALQAAVQSWNSDSCLRSEGKKGCRQSPVYFEFSSMEASDRRWYPEQLLVLSRTNVLIGVHGAGLMNQIWLPLKTSSLVEVKQGANENFHYHNIASFLGQRYYHLESTAQIEDMKMLLPQVLDDTASRMVKDQHAAGTAASAADAVV